MAIVWAVKIYRFIQKFIIKTDHRPLVYLFGFAGNSSKLTKFRIMLEEFDFIIEYCPGKQNVTADALSRVSLSECSIKSEELKELSLMVTTRHQAKMEKSQKDNEKLEKTHNSGIDHPSVVELLRYPKGLPELRFFKNETELMNYSQTDLILSPLKNVGYLPVEKILWIKLAENDNKITRVYGKIMNNRKSNSDLVQIIEKTYYKSVKS